MHTTCLKEGTGAGADNRLFIFFFQTQNTEDDDMIKVTGINKENRNLFLPAVDTLSLAVCDIILGAYDEKTDTACGILAAESEDNGQTGYSFAIRHIYVNEDWRGKGVGRALINALMDLSLEAGAKTLLCCHMENEGSENDLSIFFEALGFKRTKDTLPVYAFRLSEIDKGKADDKISCIPLKELEDRKWRELLLLAEKKSAVINVKRYYDENISSVVYDGREGLKGALLISRRNGVLAVDRVLITKENRTRILEALIYQAVTEAEKLCPPGTEIGIMLTDQDQEMTVKELTGFKAEKVGSFAAHVLQ